MRVAMGVEYQGTNFHGWQTQANNIRTVQQTLENAISNVAANAVTIQCAGRTDAGVHATGQVIHFDTNANRTIRDWIMGTNRNLPPDISVNWAKYVTQEFHARFTAIARHYRYIIINCANRPALVRQFALWNHDPLDADRMQEAATKLIGIHDFSSYRAAGCQAKNPIRNVNYIKIYRQKQYIFIEIGASGFLYHMVRNIVGVLMTIGRKERAVNWAVELLKLKSRAAHKGITAAPQGLYLTRIDYPQNFELPINSCNPFLPNDVEY